MCELILPLAVWRHLCLNRKFEDVLGCFWSGGTSRFNLGCPSSDNHLKSKNSIFVAHQDVGEGRRYEKRHANIPAHVSPCFRVSEGDTVVIGQCRWVSSIRYSCRELGVEVLGAFASSLLG
jgi:hypothetical protein